jgi:hypothetical protein
MILFWEQYVQNYEETWQGQLHPNLEVLGLTGPGRELNPGLRSKRRAL